MNQNPEKNDLADLRVSYARAALDIADTHPDPLVQFGHWMDDARSAQLVEPNAMTLATADPAGVPSARTVLLKGLDERGFVFYSNYESRKGAELAANPRAALCFLWKELERQVLVRGAVSKLSREESNRYFKSRPPGHQIGAWASTQSQEIPDRQWMVDREAELTKQFPTGEIPLPDFSPPPKSSFGRGAPTASTIGSSIEPAESEAGPVTASALRQSPPTSPQY